jgi:Cu2+-exporting ATPase
MEYHLVHGIPGRVRVRFDAEYLTELTTTNGKPSLEMRLRAQPGICEVRLNPQCRSAVLEYDPAVRTEEDVLRLLSGTGLVSVNGNHATSPTPTEDNEPESRLPLVLSSAAIGMCVVAESALVPVLIAGAALPIFRRAYAALTQRRELTVDVLDAIATVVLTWQGQFGTAAAMAWLVSLGDYIRDKTVEKSHRIIEDLFDGKSQTAWVVRDGQKCRLPIEEVREGDELVVYTGELVPADGTVTQGVALVDQAMLTGESMPVQKNVGDTVFAGTAVRDGKLYFTAEHLGRDTMASKIIRLVEQAPVRETRIQNYAERFANRMVPWSLLGASGCFLATGNVHAAAAFLIVDYGTGIRVAAPTTVLSSLAAAARQGILIKGGGRYLEVLADVDMIVFDKTGTLTKGIPDLVAVLPIGAQLTAANVLTVAAAAEARLNHPFAQAIERAAEHHGLTVPDRETSSYTIGLGVEAVVQGSRVLVGCDRFMELKNIELDGAADQVQELNDGITTPVYVALDGQLVGVLAFRVPLHPEVPAVVQALRERGIRDIVMLTGDNPVVAERVASTCGIEWYVGGTLPEDKCEFVRFLQRRGHCVALVGDGVNDSPALAQADVGIAVRGGTDVASETAHVVLLEDNLWKIPQAIDFARQSVGLIRQNWDLNFYPNTAALGLSLTGLVGAVGATVISNGSAVLATLNGLRPLVSAKGLTPAR